MARLDVGPVWASVGLNLFFIIVFILFTEACKATASIGH
jgi:hypothetical protein